MPSVSCQTSVRPFVRLKETCKRKREFEETEVPIKREKYSEASVIDSEQHRKTPTPSESQPVKQRSGLKRKREDSDDKDETPNKKKTLSPHQSASSESRSKTNTRTAFEAKYTEEEKLGEGGFGLVFSGYRKEDNLPVAIKHIPQEEVTFAVKYVDGKAVSVPLEVMLLEQVQPVSAVAKLLDWFDLKSELILVLERPVPCVDLSDFIDSEGGFIEECDAKIITQQLVDSLIDIHSQGVFHRDIKLENILMETSSSGHRVRIIDFGCGALLKDGVYKYGPGTLLYKSPEWVLYNNYTAEGATVWQVGVIVYVLLHGLFPFMSNLNIIYDRPVVNMSLSRDCRDFIRCSLEKDVLARPTLQRLRQHPWLAETRTEGDTAGTVISTAATQHQLTHPAD